MRYNQLGRTGLFVSEICLGTMTFGGQTSGAYQAMGALSQSELDAQLERALAAGVNFIDTADVYSAGQAEQMLGVGLKTLGVARKDVVVATKATRPTGAGPNDVGASRGHIMDSVRASLDRLQLDHIDLYQIHANDVVTPVEETMRALDDLARQGVVRYIGVSNWQAWKIAKALGISEARGYMRFETLQAYYSIAGRDAERELIPMLESEGLGLMVWSPLAGGLLSGKFKPDADKPQDARRTTFEFPPVELDRAWKCLDVMREVAAAHGVSVAQVAIAWLLHKPVVTSVIIGAKTMAQLDDNLAAVDVTFTADEMARLDAVSELPQEYPNWALAAQGVGRIPAPFKRKS